MARNENKVQDSELANLSAEERQDIAPDAGGSGAPHLTPNKEQLLAGADRPSEDFVAPRFVEAEVEEEVDPIDAEAERLVRQENKIPRDLDLIITPDARLRFADVVLHEGDRTTAPGRYRNVDDLNEVVEIQQNAVVPDGLRLISDQYLVQEPNRSALLGRRLRGINSNR